MKKVFFISAAVIVIFLISSCVFLYKLGDKVIEMSLEATIQSELDKATDMVDDMQITEQSSDNKQASNDLSSMNSDQEGINATSDKLKPLDNKEGNITQVGSSQTVKRNETDQQKKDKAISVGSSKDKANSSKEGIQIKPPESRPVNKVIPVQKVKEIKDKITLTEKVKVSMILLDRLKMEDVSELKGMLTGGVTEEEKKRAKEIVYSRLTEKEINEIKDIYDKYMYMQF